MQDLNDQDSFAMNPLKVSFEFRQLDVERIVPTSFDY